MATEKCNADQQGKDFKAYTATYSPDDNKLRLYAGGRLPPDTYAQVRAAGFKWAPKQELFVAPMWTPNREDLLLELCGEIGDDDTSLAERAEERAGRFEDYGESRAADAEQARKAVAAIADNIPLGQPILIGHHSERHARRDAEKIENGMRRAVKMWETSRYWEDRARGALRHAKYKERPDVRARRIKGLEADKRKQERSRTEAQHWLKHWSLDGLTLEQARALANVCHLRVTANGADYWSAYDVLQPDKERYTRCPAWTVEQVQEVARRAYPGTIAWCDRWISHYDHRLVYERAMLADAGGTVADRTGPEAGGGCKCWAGPRGGWAYIQKVNRVSVTVLDNWGNGGGNFRRVIPFDKLQGIMTRAQVDEARAAGLILDTEDKTGFYLRERPGDGTKEETPAERNDRLQREHLAAVAEHDAVKHRTVAATVPNSPALPAEDFEAMRNRLRQGIQILTAPQLFPTPPDLAARMVELAGIYGDDLRILEPSAGTGAILDAIHSPDAQLVAVEINHQLAGRLRQQYAAVDVHAADFLSLNGELGMFDRVLMNPPFENAVDIKHIRHALTMLKPGGRLVAICANGPRQREQLQPIAAEWHDLEPGTFKQQGTAVSAALLVIDQGEG